MRRLARVLACLIALSRVAEATYVNDGHNAQPVGGVETASGAPHTIDLDALGAEVMVGEGTAGSPVGGVISVNVVSTTSGAGKLTTDTFQAAGVGVTQTNTAGYNQFVLDYVSSGGAVTTLRVTIQGSLDGGTTWRTISPQGKATAASGGEIAAFGNYPLYRANVPTFTVTPGPTVTTRLQASYGSTVAQYPLTTVPVGTQVPAAYPVPMLGFFDQNGNAGAFTGDVTTGDVSVGLTDSGGLARYPVEASGTVNATPDLLMIAGLNFATNAATPIALAASGQVGIAGFNGTTEVGIRSPPTSANINVGELEVINPTDLGNAAAVASGAPATMIDLSLTAATNCDSGGTGCAATTGTLALTQNDTYRFFCTVDTNVRVANSAATAVSTDYGVAAKTEHTWLLTNPSPHIAFLSASAGHCQISLVAAQP